MTSIAACAAMPGVAQAANVTYLTMQVRQGDRDVRSMVVGIARPGQARPGRPPYLVAGRHITRSHYEAVADIATGFRIGDRIRIRRNLYTVVGLTRRMVSSGGDPMVFIPLKDAQDRAVPQGQRRGPGKGGGAPRPTRPSTARRARPAGSGDRLPKQQHLRQCRAGAPATGPSPGAVAAGIRRWQRLTAYTRAQMEEILVGKMIATSAKQISMFLVILAVVSAAIVAFIIYTLTMDKIREIAVLKLIGTRNRTIAAMILQQALALGAIGFVVGKITATFAAPLFPKYVLLVPQDSLTGFLPVMVICVLASLVSIRMALRVDPAEAIGG
jgi:putative ABC transport system permease protein